MITILRVAGKLLWRHWPALAALFLAGLLGRYLAIEVAGFVGAYSALGGALLVPLAILSRLTALVAMLLVLRRGMAHLGVIAPIPEDPAVGRREFINALLGGILPFVAFYAAWGMLREDMVAYNLRLLEVNTELIADTVSTGAERAGDAAAGELSLGIGTIAIVVVAFGLRWAWRRYREQLPRVFAIGAVYLEILWVFLSVTLIVEATGYVTRWIDSRQAMVWLGQAREWLAAQMAPVAFLWDGVEWFLGEVGGIVLLPLAWLTIAGVIYGQAVVPETLRVSGTTAERARSRFATVPQRVRVRLVDLWNEIVGRFKPIGRAVVLMWRAGPLLIGSYVLLYTLLLGMESLVEIGVTRIIGPQPLVEFWMTNATVIFLIAPVIIEPLRISLVASSYDAVITRLVPAPAAATDA
ncbi:hypothetical protein ACWPKO_29530 (plasmid) [Coraliomargarita sp. W4R53]